MRSGLVSRLRRFHAVVRWLVALLLLPVVLGVLPPAELSAEQALARDLALAMCSPNGGHDPAKSTPSHDQQCVLCTIGCVTGASVAPGGAFAGLAPAPTLHSAALAPAAQTLPHWSLWRQGAPPRGPPTSLVI